jgi:hypothetical protein
MSENWIARIGQNIQVVAFFAHFGVAALLVEHLPWHLATAVAITLASALKEYGFDAAEETDPPQTFWDNTEERSGQFD